ncbi:MAG: hypothetical protein KF773_16695 [Deltaproteobacteria bacterium]|nr:hypothetical protein [Deltaproteobacteria bacterium]MCW5804525.1 hypothetical protein [Deltaproteobacteria bacterium]
MKGVALGVLVAIALLAGGGGGCGVRLIGGRSNLTGTCEGACAHYIRCKPGHPAADKQRCDAECPEVFSDRDSLMAYESLQCTDAVEFVDGRTAKSAKTGPRK